MKPKLSPKQAFALYGIVLGFVFTFYLIGLLIGKNYVEDTAALTIPESASEPLTDVTPMLDFYQQLESREITPERSTSREAVEERHAAEKSLPASDIPQENITSPETLPDEVESDESQTSFQEPSKDVTASLKSENESTGQIETPVSTEESGASYTIQIGAFSTLQEARQVVLRLEAKNFSARLQPPSPGESPPYYRVLVGGVSTVDEARRLEEQLKKESFPTYLKKLD